MLALLPVGPPCPQAPELSAPVPPAPTEAVGAAGPDLCLAQRAVQIPREDWHSLEVSGKSHSPPGPCPKPTWHLNAAPSRWEAGLGRGWGARGQRSGCGLAGSPACLSARLAPRKAELFSLVLHLLLGEAGEDRCEPQRKKEIPASGVWIREGVGSF